MHVEHSRAMNESHDESRCPINVDRSTSILLYHKYYPVVAAKIHCHEE